MIVTRLSICILLYIKKYNNRNINMYFNNITTKYKIKVKWKRKN